MGVWHLFAALLTSATTPPRQVARKMNGEKKLFNLYFYNFGVELLLRELLLNYNYVLQKKDYVIGLNSLILAKRYRGPIFFFDGK